MSAHRRAEASPPGQAARLDPVCDRFESEWLAGRRPLLEEYLPLAKEADRPALLRELLRLDIDYRAREGERPTAEEYQRRLSGQAAVIAALFAEPPTGAAEPSLRTLRPGLLPGGPQPPSEALARRSTRYEIEEELARGGMGAVWRARDPELNRSLAIKVLLEKHQGNAELEGRFREEAQITGQLQHPGIPPVHEVGTLPDGRPFFAMKLINGRTLAELLKDRPSPADELPRFLGIFEQVAQTLAYAHSHGVIHRDLKPGNIMVGAFGEVQVMDWGLAKVLSTGGTQPSDREGLEASAVSTVRSVAPELATLAGLAMGTPAYMAPEQARGEVEQLDERSDVFGLGGILCQILTGQPPYQGAGWRKILEQAARADMADTFARLDSSGADPELIQLARTCLAPVKEDRPRDAGAVARTLNAHLTGVQERAREAERRTAAAEARAEEARARARAERRARRLTLGLAAMLLLALLAGVYVRQQQLAARAEQARLVEDNLREVAERRLVTGHGGV
jgi:tRNA A-37 threonylcarbamoyl transferase component Bud32